MYDRPPFVVRTLITTNATPNTNTTTTLATLVTATNQLRIIGINVRLLVTTAGIISITFDIAPTMIWECVISPGIWTAKKFWLPPGIAPQVGVDLTATHQSDAASQAVRVIAYYYEDVIT